VYVFGLEKMEKLQELEMGENKGGLLALSAREEPRYLYFIIHLFIYLFYNLFFNSFVYSIIHLFIVPYFQQLSGLPRA